MQSFYKEALKANEKEALLLAGELLLALKDPDTPEEAQTQLREALSVLYGRFPGTDFSEKALNS